MFHLLAVLLLVLGCLPEPGSGGKVVGRRRERQVVQGRQGSGGKGAVMPAARPAKAAPGEGSSTVRGRGGQGGRGAQAEKGRKEGSAGEGGEGPWRGEIREGEE